MSSKNLFEESSSEEDESNLNLGATQEKAAADPPTRTIKEEEEEEEEEEEDKETPVVAAAAENSEGKGETTENVGESNPLEDSDDDEGDAEFDDGGAIVGTSAPAQKAKDTDGDGNVPTTSEAGGKASAKPPQNATVLEVDRPAKDVSLYMTKLPNLVAIQPSAFDEDTYDEKEEEDQYKGYVHNMIRWKYKEDANGNEMRNGKGELMRESNSRLVKWSDGSFTMHIGNDAFDIQTIDSSANGFAGLNGYVYLSQKATFSNEGEDDETPGGTVLECIGPISSRLVAKPSSLQSEAHKSLTVQVRQKTLKKARIEQYVTQEDPEKAKQERIRYNEDADKIQSRKRSQQYRSTTSRQRTPGMNKRYMEDPDDDNYDNINIKALKKGSVMEDDMDDYGDESDGDDDYDETFRSRSRKRKKKVEEEEDDEEEELVFDEESDEDVTLIKAHKKKRSGQAIEDDDDED